MSRLICDNPDHRGLPNAIARLTWPDGRFKPCLACRTCLRWQVLHSIDGTHGTIHSVLVEPVDAP